MFERLRSPADIGRVRLANRFILSPMHTMLGGPFGEVTRDLVEFYRERALGGAALVVVEYSYVDDYASQSNVTQISVAGDRFVPGLARLAEAIHHGGALAGLQLSHAGRQRFLGVDPIVAPSRIPWEELRAAGASTPRELTVEEIAGIVRSFGAAARRVQQAGYDVIELHAGHGALINQFLSPLTNRRGDLYGGPLVDRQRFLREVVEAVGEAGLPIVARLAAFESRPGGITFEETVATAQMLEAAGVAALDVSAGDMRSLHLQVQPMGAPAAPHAAPARAVKEAVAIPVLFAGSITSAELAEQVLANGDADFVRLARPLLADADFPRKALAGRPETITPCIRCNECLDSGTSLRRAIRCAVNFRCGREALLGEQRPARAPLAVAVVGGGPAGLEAAFRAVEAGHRVTLFERDRIGGSLNAIAREDFKSELLGYRDYLVRRLGGLVEVRGEATPSELAALDPDVVILAAGALPAARADGASVDSRSATSDPGALGSYVVLDGADRFSTEVATFLARRGLAVTIAAPERELAADVGAHTRVPLLEDVRALGVDWRPGSAVLCRADGGCRVRGPDGSVDTIRCDTIVTTRYAAEDDLLTQLAAGPWQAVRIGDCASPGRIIHAIEDANLALARARAEPRQRA